MRYWFHAKRVSSGGDSVGGLAFMVDSRRTAGVRSRVRAAIIGVFCLLSLAGAAAIVVALTSNATGRWAAHSRDVRQAYAALFAAVQDAETGQRGFLLTGDASYLAPFDAAEHRLPGMMAGLSLMVADNPAQQARVASLDSYVDRKMRELRRAVALKKAGRSDAAIAIVKTNEGRDLMERVRAAGQDFDRTEARLFDQRQAETTRQRGILLDLIVLALVFAVLLACFGAVEGRRHAEELAAQNLALKQAVDERERAEAQLRQAQKMEALGQLTGGVAHDFNNMLAIIVGNLDMVLRRLTDQDGRVRLMIENALQGANRAGALTKRLLAFSRLQPLDPRPVDVNKCVGDMSEMLRRALGEQIAIETVLAGGLWPAFIDCPQLESAILNLAVNARDAMPEGGRLTIETANASLDRAYADENAEVAPGQYVLVAISDTGAGMTEDVIAKAFDPFFTTKRVGEGTGLGLSQVHGFLKQSRGHIKLYSEPGIGTSVKLYLPRDTGAAAPAEPPRAHLTPPTGGPFTLLIVEDEPGVRTFAVSAARELGYEVVEADSAAVAMECLARRPEISVMLTDVVMPKTTGRQLVDAALVSRPDLCVIYMTGYTRNAIVHNGALDPGTRLLTKPFTLDQLEMELRDALTDHGLST
jgi:signal transduction histidine kinase